MITYWNYNYANYGTVGLVIWILIWLIIIGVVIEVIRAIFGSSTKHYIIKQPPVPPPAHPAATEKSPLEILNARYAKGEINKEEYEQKKADINRPHAL